MNNTSAEIDWGRTGGSEGSSFIHVDFDLKKTIFTKGWGDKKEELASNFAGVLTDFQIRWNGSPKEGTDIPPHWEYSAILDAMDKESGEIRKHKVTLHGHWNNTILTDFLNAVAGAMANPSWNSYIRISLWAKTPAGGRKANRVTLYGYDEQKLPLAFEWDEDARGFKGVPKPENEDWTPVRNFWHNIALSLASKFGHTYGETPKSAPPQKPKEPEYTKEHGSVVDDIEADKAKSGKFYLALAKQCETLSDPLTVVTGLEQLWKKIMSKPESKPSAWATTDEQLEKELTRHYVAVTGDAGGYFKGGKVFVSDTKPPEDLPF